MIYLQIPTICISHSIENAKSAEILKERYNVIEDMGYFKDVNKQSIHNAIKRLLNDLENYKNMTRNCYSLIDGKGVHRLSQLVMGVENV